MQRLIKILADWHELWHLMGLKSRQFYRLLILDDSSWKERGQWASVYYTTPQSFMKTFSYSLA